MQILHALAASKVQSRQFLAITLREQLYKKMKTPLKNLTTHVLAKAYTLTLHGLIQSHETVPYRIWDRTKKSFSQKGSPAPL